MKDGIDYAREFESYLQRFEEAVGDVDFGAFVKHGGRLVQKMRFEEFEPVYREYFQLAKSYFSSIDRGDTINDVVVRMLKSRASELFLTSPA